MREELKQIYCPRSRSGARYLSYRDTDGEWKSPVGRIRPMVGCEIRSGVPGAGLVIWDTSRVSLIRFNAVEPGRWCRPETTEVIKGLRQAVDYDCNGIHLIWVPVDAVQEALERLWGAQAAADAVRGRGRATAVEVCRHKWAAEALGGKVA